MAILHAIFVLAFVAAAIGKLVSTVAIHLVIFPVTSVAVAIGPLENTVAIFLVVFVIALVAIAITPLVNTVAMLLVIFPRPLVAVAIEGTAIPHHAALTVSLAVFQIAFVGAIRKDRLGLWLLPFYLSLVFITFHFPV